MLHNNLKIKLKNSIISNNISTRYLVGAYNMT